jgi:hypothetical protein
VSPGLQSPVRRMRSAQSWPAATQLNQHKKIVSRFSSYRDVVILRGIAIQPELAVFAYSSRTGWQPNAF